MFDVAVSLYVRVGREVSSSNASWSLCCPAIAGASAGDKIRLLGFTHYTTRMLRNSAMPGPLTPRHKGTVYSYLSRPASRCNKASAETVLCKLVERLSPSLMLRSLFVGLGSASAYNMMPSRMAGPVQMQPRAAVAQLPTWNERSSPAAHFRMQVEEDIKAEDIYDDFMGLDESGASVPLGLDEKEKLYLECLDSFYNEGGKAVLPDNKYEQLKVPTPTPIPTATPTLITPPPPPPHSRPD